MCASPRWALMRSTRLSARAWRKRFGARLEGGLARGGRAWSPRPGTKLLSEFRDSDVEAAGSSGWWRKITGTSSTRYGARERVRWPCGHVAHGWQSDLPVQANWHGWLCHGASTGSRSWRQQYVRCGGSQCRYPTMVTTSTTNEGGGVQHEPVVRRSACHMWQSRVTFGFYGLGI